MPKPQNESEKFDVRVLEHRYRRGVITDTDYAEFLSTLPDDAEEAEETTTRFTNAYQQRVDEEGEA